MPTPQLWTPAQDSDWPVVSSATLLAETHDVVRIFNRGAFAGELILSPSDGAELLMRLGLEVTP